MFIDNEWDEIASDIGGGSGEVWEGGVGWKGRYLTWLWM